MHQAQNRWRRLLPVLIGGGIGMLLIPWIYFFPYLFEIRIGGYTLSHPVAYPLLGALGGLLYLALVDIFGTRFWMRRSGRIALFGAFVSLVLAIPLFVYLFSEPR